MGYVLRNGKRYYQDSDGKLILDNVSQHEADCRGRQSAGDSPVCHETDTGVTEAGSRLLGLIIVVLMLLVGAFIYNRCSVSPAEQAIEDYMNWLNGTSVVETEPMDEEATVMEAADEEGKQE